MPHLDPPEIFGVPGSADVLRLIITDANSYRLDDPELKTVYDFFEK